MNRFTPLSEIVAKELKNKRFRKAYTEEMNRLQLAYEIGLFRAQSISKVGE